MMETTRQRKMLLLKGQNLQNPLKVFKERQQKIPQTVLDEAGVGSLFLKFSSKGIDICNEKFIN